MLVDTVHRFVTEEMIPHEDVVERERRVPEGLRQQIFGRSRELGLYACNMPAEHEGGGLGPFDTILVEKELGRTAMAMAECCWRPTNILQASTGAQIDRYLVPTIEGSRRNCIAITEPDAGSDLRGMKTTAVRDGEA